MNSGFCSDVFNPVRDTDIKIRRLPCGLIVKTLNLIMSFNFYEVALICKKWNMDVKISIFNIVIRMPVDLAFRFEPREAGTPNGIG